MNFDTTYAHFDINLEALELGEIAGRREASGGAAAAGEPEREPVFHRSFATSPKQAPRSCGPVCGCLTAEEHLSGACR